MLTNQPTLAQRICLVHNCTQEVAVQILSKKMLSYRQRMILVLFHTNLNNFRQQHFLFIKDLSQCTTYGDVMDSLRYWKQRWRPQTTLESIVYFKGSQALQLFEHYKAASSN